MDKYKKEIFREFRTLGDDCMTYIRSYHRFHINMFLYKACALYRRYYKILELIRNMRYHNV